MCTTVQEFYNRLEVEAMSFTQSFTVHLTDEVAKRIQEAGINYQRLAPEDLYTIDMSNVSVDTEKDHPNYTERIIIKVDDEPINL